MILLGLTVYGEMIRGLGFAQPYSRAESEGRGTGRTRLATSWELLTLGCVRVF